MSFSDYPGGGVLVLEKGRFAHEQTPPPRRAVTSFKFTYNTREQCRIAISPWWATTMDTPTHFYFYYYPP